MNYSKWLVVGLAVMGIGPRAQAAHCVDVGGKIATEITAQGCQSPVGLCTAGQITESLILRGKTFYTTARMVPDAADPTGASSLAYTGTLTIDTRWGRLTVKDSGILDQVGKHFSELSLNLSGAGALTGVTGYLFFTGDLLETGFNGRVRGELCFK